ncbi:MAG: protein kinase [Dehalococcoidia bacterium]|nr:protein kinase [Dehalococcoidia bacterium]
MAGEVVAGRYTIVDEIGRGASSTLYRAEDAVLGRVVAIKAMSAALSADPNFVERFTAEARLAARLDHPNIVTVYDVGVMDDDRPFISMKLIEGMQLDDYAKAHPDLGRHERIALLSQVASALDYIHSRGLVHRDVKPANILVDAQGNATLMDFGVAVAVDSVRLTQTGMIVGTPRYMAPEQVQGFEATPATDIYALGVVAYELLSGGTPFSAAGTALLYQIVNDAPQPIRNYDADISGGAASVVERALSKDPTARFDRASDFIAALLAELPSAAVTTVITPAVGATRTPAPANPPSTGGAVVPPVQPPTAAVSAAGGGRNNRRLIATAGALVVGAIIGLAIFAMLSGGGGDDDDRPAITDDERTATAEAEDDDEEETATVRATSTPTSRPSATATMRPTSTPTLAPTATPTFRWSQIESIKLIDNGTRYSVDFKVGNFVPNIVNDFHVHFFFNTVLATNAGNPGSGPWILYDTPSPFTGYSVAEGAGATKMCILVANPDHSVNQGTGNCVDLP